MWRRWLILVAALGLLLAACGGEAGTEGIASLEDETAEGSTTTALAASTDPEQAMLDFTQCMRDHGVDMPDPQMGPGGGSFGFTIQGEAGEAPADGEMQQMQEASEACNHLLEGMVQEFEMPDMSEMQDQMLAFSQCMRDHGIDYPDPEFTEDGGITMSIGPGDEGGIDPSDPGFQEAQEACQEIFGGGFGGPLIIGSTDAPGVGGEGEGGMVIIGGGGAVPAPGGDE
ncbi:MAG: hypothetical protein MUE66_04240 [Acidimicrobiia bacterium]|jgi:hypothetical protein|nr:hypothetical protein [Acidimicrobiia bacterium]